MRDKSEPNLPDRDEVYMTPEEVARRWHMDPATLANQRHAGRSIAYVKLPSGKILYALSDVLRAEADGRSGFIPERVWPLIASAPGITENMCEKIREHVRRGLQSPRAA